MANYRAIAATSTALSGLIRDRYPRDEFGSGLEVSLYQMRDFESPMQDGFSVCLYRVAVNGSVRNLTLRRSADGRRFRPSLLTSSLLLDCIFIGLIWKIIWPL